MEFGFLDPAPPIERFPQELFPWLLSGFAVVKNESAFGVIVGGAAALLGAFIGGLGFYCVCWLQAPNSPGSVFNAVTALVFVCPLALVAAILGFGHGVKWARLSAHYNETVARAAEQVAVAFGLTDWQHMETGGDQHYFDVLQSDFAKVGHFGRPCEEFFFSIDGAVKIGWWMSPNFRPFEISVQIQNGKRSNVAQLSYNRETSKYELLNVGAASEAQELMARGLYRLGFEDEGVLAELRSPLTAHEKLELRLSMPREFWPKTWLDEEGAGTA